MGLFAHLNSDLESQMSAYWMNLSRFTSLLIILNISLSFLPNC